jgi:predicted RNase H-like HicB family nuclease
MKFRVGIENNNEGRSVAWAVEHPGCYAYGKDADHALANLPEVILTYAEWIGQHETPWLAADEIELMIDDEWDVYYVNNALERVSSGEDTTSIEAWFQHDWKPLTATDIERAIKLLAWSRQDLLGTVKGLSPEKIAQTYPGERWSIEGILKHIGGAEWWYLERIGFPNPVSEKDVPDDPFERLGVVRNNFNYVLPKLEGMHIVAGLDGEFWSPRKSLRRALWHERDHAEHIRKLL